MNNPITWTTEQKNMARKENSTLSETDLVMFWNHYTIGAGKGHLNGVNESTSFEDFCVISALNSIDDRRYNR